MSAIMIILLCLCLVQVKITGIGEFHQDYCAPGKANSLKGIFVLMVFVSHFRTYVELTPADSFAVSVVTFLGQLMVAPFLFYSGFGVMESIRKKGPEYVRGIPANRVLKTALHAEMALMLYVLLKLILGEMIPPKKMLLSLLFWESIGNSTWYIVAIVVLYIITWISFRMSGEKLSLGAALTTALSVVYVCILIPIRSQHWYNTVLCYALGMWYSLLRNRIQAVVMKNGICYWLMISVTAALFLTVRSVLYNSWIYQCYAMIFMVLVVGISMKVQLDNKFLQFLGKHIFSLYILQRLPMIFLTEKNILTDNTILLFVVCFAVTCVLAIVFDKIMEKLDSALFGKRKSVSHP